ncbi:MAG TPA: 30S ribosomal protein THX [Pyrinomonadaceae bacterium]|nr:30S ribosomal protein THX [Pyrinomonadaceae bacterium]
MGKGDKRSRRGKIFAGSFGKTRPKFKKQVYVPSEHVGAGAAEAAPKERKPKVKKKKVEEQEAAA